LTLISGAICNTFKPGRINEMELYFSKARALSKTTLCENLKRVNGALIQQTLHQQFGD